MADKKRTKADTLIDLGIELRQSSGHERKGECPFCQHRGENGKTDYLQFNENTGQWRCFFCRKEGNLYTFLTLFSQKTAAETHHRDWNLLSSLKGQLPVEVFQRQGMGWTGTAWLIPQKNEKGTVVNIAQWNGRGTHVTTGLNWHLFGVQELLAAPPHSRVWIVEGWSDFMVWRWFLDLAGRKNEVVVAAPSATVFKKEWAAYFQGHEVILVGDNDGPGDDFVKGAHGLLYGVARKVQQIGWPETRPTGWDLRDYVQTATAKQVDPFDAVRELEEFLQDNPDRHPKVIIKPNDDRPIPTFQEVLDVFGKWLKMDVDVERALALSLATCLCNDIPGDPIFLYVIGVPSSAKSVILMALQGSERVEYQSSMTPRALISGWNQGPDPSLLPKFDGRTAVFKDGTGIITMHPDAKREIYGVLRDAFDGEVRRVFGNCVRHYRTHFNMLIGITRAVYGESQAIMGDRFLKFEMRQDLVDIETKMDMAMQSASKEVEMAKELSDVCARFMNQKIDPNKLPDVSAEWKAKVKALARFTAVLRGQAEYESGDGAVLKYRPSTEAPIRILKQMVKLLRALSIVYGTAIDKHAYEIVHKIGMDTCIGYHLDIVREIIRLGNRPLTREQIAGHAGIEGETLSRRLRAMTELGILHRASGEQGKMAWIVAEHVTKFYWDCQTVKVAPEIIAAQRPTRNGMPEVSVAALLKAQKGKNGSGPLREVKMAHN